MEWKEKVIEVFVLDVRFFFRFFFLSHPNFLRSFDRSLRDLTFSRGDFALG